MFFVIVLKINTSMEKQLAEQSHGKTYCGELYIILYYDIVCEIIIDWNRTTN